MFQDKYGCYYDSNAVRVFEMCLMEVGICGVLEFHQKPTYYHSLESVEFPAIFMNAFPDLV